MIRTRNPASWFFRLVTNDDRCVCRGDALLRQALEARLEEAQILRFVHHA
jgi:hypothetical protein